MYTIPSMMILFVYIDVCLHFLYYTYAHFTHTAYIPVPVHSSLFLYIVSPCSVPVSVCVPPLPPPFLSLSFVHMLHCSFHTPVWKFSFFQCIWEPFAVLPGCATCIHAVFEQVFQQAHTCKIVVEEDLMMFSVQLRGDFTTLAPKAFSGLSPFFPEYTSNFWK